ncbi:MAG: hypothetical protein HN337_00170 [Deltaproteobacteria bacterium]|jgi:hypothetical protein|nr:hypothetical protein [Deltaproteobacteria bacterium]
MRRISIIAVFACVLILIPMLVELHALDSNEKTSDSTATSEGAAATPSSSCGNVFLGSNKDEGGDEESDDTEKLDADENKPKTQSFTGFVSLTGGEAEEEAKDGYCEYVGEELVCYVDGKEYRGCKPLDDGTVECSAN